MSWSLETYSPLAHVLRRGVAVFAVLVSLVTSAPLASGAALESGTVSTVSRAPYLSARALIGHSVEGRKIVATRYGDPLATRVVVVIGVIHGSEQGGLPIVRRLAALGAPEDTAMWIIPTVNPDGQRRYTRQNARGVDLNRNTSDRWRRGPSGLYFPGKQAVSEPETRAYMAFLAAVNPDFVAIFHQHGNGIDSYRAKNPAIVAGLSQRLGLPIKSFACSGVCRGTLTGWFNFNFAGSANTIELPARVTTARVNRWAAGLLSEALVVPDFR